MQCVTAFLCFFFQAEDGIRDKLVTGVQTCALPISRLRVRAAHGKRSMEEEARHILRKALSQSVAGSPDLAHAIRRRFAPLGGVDLRLPERELAREPPVPDR